MDSFSSSSIAACPEATGEILCSPDPLRFYVGDDAAEESLELELETLVDSCESGGACLEAPRLQNTCAAPGACVETRVCVDALNTCADVDPSAKSLTYFTVFNDLCRRLAGQYRIYPACPSSTEAGVIDHWANVAPVAACTATVCTPATAYLAYDTLYPAISPTAYGLLCRLGITSCYTLAGSSGSDGNQRGHNFSTLYGLKFYSVLHISAISSTIFNTHSRGYNADCNYKYKTNAPWTCYGYKDGHDWFDGNKPLDGVAVAWAGNNWSLWNGNDSAFTNANVQMFGTRTDWSPSTAKCFGYSSTVEGDNKEFNSIRWGLSGWVRGGYPLDWVEGGHWGTYGGFVGAPQLQNGSNGMKSKATGLFHFTIGTPQIDAACSWSSFSYSISTWLQYLNPQNSQNYEAMMSFQHTWTDRDWTFQFHISPTTAGVTASPTNDEQAWQNHHLAKFYF